MGFQSPQSISLLVSKHPNFDEDEKFDQVDLIFHKQKRPKHQIHRYSLIRHFFKVVKGFQSPQLITLLADKVGQ